MNRPLLLIVDDNQELADLLGQLFEEAGYRARMAYRGEDALAALREEKPALAVIDLLLPDLVGYEVARAFSEEGVPYVFMTGVFKGDMLEEEGLAGHGAHAYFQKPFESGELVRAVQKIVPVDSGQAADSLGLGDLDLDIDVVEQEGTLAPIELELTGRIAVGGGGVKAVLTGEDFRLGRPEPGETIVRNAAPETTPVPDPRGVARSGELSDNLPQLIAAFWQLRNTGELLLERGRVKKVICFEKGWPVFALSNLAADRYGSFLMRVGRITSEQLQQAMDRASKEGRRTGEILIEMGLLTDAERMYYVAQQVKAIIYSLFAWTEGRYRMVFRDEPRLEPIRLGMHPAQLISRGIKKLYKPERLRRILAPEDRLIATKDPVFQMNEMEFELWETRLLAQIDGERTVAELIALTDKPEDQVYATLVAIHSLRFFEKR